MKFDIIKLESTDTLINVCVKRFNKNIVVATINIAFYRKEAKFDINCFIEGFKQYIKYDTNIIKFIYPPYLYDYTYNDTTLVLSINDNLYGKPHFNLKYYTINKRFWVGYLITRYIKNNFRYCWKRIKSIPGAIKDVFIKSKITIENKDFGYN